MHSIWKAKALEETQTLCFQLGIIYCLVIHSKELPCPVLQGIWE